MPLEFKRSGAYGRWIQETLPCIPIIKPLDSSFYFKIDVIFEYPFFHVNNKMRRLDAHNFLEALCDVIANKNGFDDSYIKFGSWEAYDAEKESARCSLSQVRLVE